MTEAQELVLVTLHKDTPVVSTKQMAEGLEVEHESIVRLISNYKEAVEHRNPVIQVNTKTGKTYATHYLLDEQQATMVTSLMRNTPRVVEFKTLLVDEFFIMRDKLAKKHESYLETRWIEQRIEGKTIRKATTDVIKDFVKYATDNGSDNAKFYYKSITNMQNKALFFLTEDKNFKNLRDILNTYQLGLLAVADNVVAKALQDGMDKKMEYHDIFKFAKTRVLSLVEVHGQSEVVPLPESKVKALSKKAKQALAA